MVDVRRTVAEGRFASCARTLAATRYLATSDIPADHPTWSSFAAMGLLTFSINVTIDGCVDHREGIADDETHAFFNRLMDEGGAMLWGRVTYEMMESYWPAGAPGGEEGPPARRARAGRLEDQPKYAGA